MKYPADSLTGFFHARTVKDVTDEFLDGEILQEPKIGAGTMKRAYSQSSI
jgi:hypothetical protein